MKEANLISICSALRSLPPDLFAKYLTNSSNPLKPEELKDLEVFVNHLKALSNDISIFDKYFVGYSIPQIGKEFDLLRIDDDSIVNIEIKKNSTDEKIKAQLVRNRYYLSFLKRNTFTYTFTADNKKLFTFDANQNLIEANFQDLLKLLASQKVPKNTDLDKQFNPSNYLVSPFNSTQEFIKGEYFLTSQQEEIKTIVLNQLGTTGHSILAIKGRAGTGKTLLAFDIAKEFMQKKEVLIVHCGLLNPGHTTLRNNYKWNIVPIKNLMYQDLSKFNLIVIDEAQRIHQHQLDHIITETTKNGGNCLCSYDGLQTLRRGEIHNKIDEKIESVCTMKPFELTSKIRTNKEVASFIQRLFNKNLPIENQKYSNIELTYFHSETEAKSYLIQLKSEDWKIINYTPSTVYTMPYESYYIEGDDNAHTVIGQEFNNVVAVISEHFYYKGGRLSTKNYRRRPYYHPTKMLFQIVSRTRLKLSIVFIGNQEVLERCLSIVGN